MNEVLIHSSVSCFGFLSNLRGEHIDTEMLNKLSTFFGLFSRRNKKYV